MEKIYVIQEQNTQVFVIVKNNKGKVDAAREEQTWYSELYAHRYPDSNFVCVYFLVYIL